MQNSSVLAHLKLKKIIFYNIFQKNLKSSNRLSATGPDPGSEKGGTNKKVSKRGIPPDPVLSYKLTKKIFFEDVFN